LTQSLKAALKAQKCNSTAFLICATPHHFQVTTLLNPVVISPSITRRAKRGSLQRVAIGSGIIKNPLDTRVLHNVRRNRFDQSLCCEWRPAREPYLNTCICVVGLSEPFERANISSNWIVFSFLSIQNVISSSIVVDILHSPVRVKSTRSGHVLVARWGIDSPLF
jgi:hypothetical protein